MKLNQAIENASELLEAYFEPFMFSLSQDEIFQLIQSHLNSADYTIPATQPIISVWERRLSGITTVLEELTDEELDELQIRSIGYLPEDIGDTRVFFQRVKDELELGIEDQKNKGLWEDKSD